MRLIDADELTKVMTEDWFLDILLTQDGKSDLRKKLVDVIDSVPLAYDVEKVIEEAKGVSRYVAYGNYDRDIGMTHRVVPFDALEKILEAGGINE